MACLELLSPSPVTVQVLTMARSAGWPGATSVTPALARLTPHWRSSPWLTLQPTETSAAVRAGSGRGAWGSVAMGESYQRRGPPMTMDPVECGYLLAPSLYTASDMDTDPQT